MAEVSAIIGWVASNFRINFKVFCHAWFWIDTSCTIIGWYILDKNTSRHSGSLIRIRGRIGPSWVLQWNCSTNMSGSAVILGTCSPATSLITVGTRQSFHSFGSVLSGYSWIQFTWGCSSGSISRNIVLDMVPLTSLALAFSSYRSLCSNLGG